MTKTRKAVALDDIDLVILAAGAAAVDGWLLPVPLSVGSEPDRTEEALRMGWPVRCLWDHTSRA